VVNRQTFTLAYDAENRLVSVSGAATANFYYDPDGKQVKTIVETPQQGASQTQIFTYDELDRLLSSNVTGGTNGLYSESYTYNGTTGNLASKGTVNYTAYDANHKHAVTNLSNGNSYGYDANGNMTSRNVNGQSFTLTYDAENRLVSVTGAATATFVYDADSKQVKATVNGVTTYYVGNHYEVKNSVVTKYYFAGATRLAVRTGGTLSYLLGDHLGSSSLTTDANGVKTASALYKAFGETRYTLGALGTDYKFTGQRLQAELGIYFYGARWYDGSLGRFTSPDTMIPSTQGVQAWDRYAYVNNNPVRYTDPTGHGVDCGVGGNDPCPSDPPQKTYCEDPEATNYGAEGSCITGDEDESISLPAALATGYDTAAFLLNAGYAIVGGVIVYIYPPSVVAVVGAYQLYSIIPNTLSSGATVFWFIEGIRTGQTSISMNFESPGTEDFSTTNIISGARISLSIDQDTAVSVVTNTAGWTVLKDPWSATIVDEGVAVYDYGRNLKYIPSVNPTFSYSTNSGWSFSWFR
jgi:RHS repeat-associated protein